MVMDPRVLPQRTVCGLNDTLFKISLKFYNNVHGINFGKAHTELLNKMTVFSFGEYVNLESAARTWVKDDNTMVVEALEQSNAPIIEFLIKANTDWGATTKRDFELIEVNIGVDKNAQKKLAEAEQEALDEIHAAKAKYSRRVNYEEDTMKKIAAMGRACLDRIESYKEHILEFNGLPIPVSDSKVPKLKPAAKPTPMQEGKAKVEAHVDFEAKDDDDPFKS